MAPAEKPLIKYAAFLRGINVGGHSVITMDELRKAFASHGFRDVKTVLASGNVLFEAPEGDVAGLSRKLSGMLEDLLGRKITVVVWPVEALKELEARAPFEAIDTAAGARPIVTFVTDDMKDRGIPALRESEGFRVLSVSGGVICSVSYDQYGVGTAEAMALIEKALGQKVTTRTWDTIKKILKASDMA